MSDTMRKKIREAWNADAKRIRSMEAHCDRNRALNPTPADAFSRAVWDDAFAKADGKGLKHI